VEDSIPTAVAQGADQPRPGLVSLSARLQVAWAAITAVVLATLTVAQAPIDALYLVLVGLPVLAIVFVAVFPLALGGAALIDRLAARARWMGILAAVLFAILSGLAGGRIFSIGDPVPASVIFAIEGAAFAFLVMRQRRRI
jgi:hypothetical protein